MKLFKAFSAAIVLAAVVATGMVFLAPAKTLHLLVDIERARSGLAMKQIDTPDGMHWAYLEGGEGPPLLLLHGFGANKDNFTRTSKWLTSRYHVIIPDLIGFGQSGHPVNADYSPDAQAERLNSFIRALNLSSINLGGNSMGGQVVLAYTALYPKHVESLWLIDPGGLWKAPDSEVKTFILKTGQNPLVVKTVKEFYPMMKWVMHQPPYLPKPLLNVIAKERVNNYDLEKKIFKAITDDSIESRIKGLKTPALIVWGTRDRIINVATAGILHDFLPRSKVVLMPGIGHLPMLEAPEKSARQFLEFRKNLPENRAG